MILLDVCTRSFFYFLVVINSSDAPSGTFIIFLSMLTHFQHLSDIFIHLGVSSRHSHIHIYPHTSTSTMDGGKCELLGGTFSTLVQASLGLICIGSLIIKRHNEVPQRDWYVWFLDVMKQGIMF